MPDKTLNLQETRYIVSIEWANDVVDVQVVQSMFVPRVSKHVPCLHYVTAYRKLMCVTRYILMRYCSENCIRHYSAQPEKQQNTRSFIRTHKRHITCLRHYVIIFRGSEFISGLNPATR